MLNPETLNGDIIHTNINHKSIYVIDVEEIQWMPDSGECMVYGEGAVLKTYADCVADEHEQIFKAILGCLPPWLAAPDNQDICWGRVTVTKGSFKQSRSIIHKLFEEQIYKTMPNSQACLKPCTEIKVNSKLIHLEKLDYDQQEIALQFKRTVKV